MSSRILLIVMLVACGGSSSNPDARVVDARSPDAAIEPPYRCDFADCKAGFARTCNADPATLDCTTFGASCGAFTDTDSGAAFNWCDCGTIAEGDGRCLDGRYGVTCASGLGGLADCGKGYLCVPRPNGPFGIGCECNNVADGVCPGLSCGADPDCATCTPTCAGKACGDNGCGGECGTCDLRDECTAAGTCVAICVPNCTQRACGSDGCGGSCGTCDGTCTAAGTCEGACVPSCDGAACGSDGCGGACGSCPDDLECSLERQCDCGFFDDVKYKLALAPQDTFPPQFTFVGINVWHIGIDGTEGRNNGTTLGFRASTPQTFNFSPSGCRPRIRIKRVYALSGKSCTADETIAGRTDIVIPAPIVDAAGNCTAPPL